MAKLPPQPVGVAPGSSYWNDWYEKLRVFVENVSTAVVNFVDLNFTGSNLQSIETRNHNDLQTIQGGNATERYHLTAAEAAILGSGSTGTGALVRANSPTLVTPVLGSATASQVRANGNYVPSSANNGTTIGTISGFPEITHVYSSGGLNSKIWNSYADGTTLYHRAVDDVFATAQNWMNVVRSGTTISSIQFPNGNMGIGVVPSGTYKLEVNGALSVSSARLIRSATALTNAAGAAVGTLNNAPVAGNPTKWIEIDDNGTIRRIPAW